MASSSTNGENGAAPAYRQFSFFNPSRVSDLRDPAASPDALKSAAEISAVTSAQGLVLVADIHGYITILNSDFESIRSFPAHEEGRVTHLRFSDLKGICISLGEDENGSSPILKVWDLRRIDKKTGYPRCLAAGRTLPTNRPYPISTWAITSSLSHIAIGHTDGSVYLIRHLDAALPSAGTDTSASLPKPKLIHSAQEPVTGLQFRQTTSIEDRNPTLYIVTTSKVVKCAASAKTTSNSAISVDDIGAGVGCSCISSESGDLILARDEGVYTYGPEGRGACYFYEGHKSFILPFLSYIVIISPPFMPSAGSNSATVRKYVADTSSLSDVAKVSIFDLENKFVAWSGTFESGVRELWAEWGDIFVLSNNSKLTRLEEKPMPEKLGILYSKNLYGLAIGLAKSRNLGPSEVAEIYRRYGDELYVKADYDGAMQQYIKTVGHLQPSYVIRKFLDGQRISVLTNYLQELHSAGLANSDITTLLLNCYTKLKEHDKLSDFIRATPSTTSPEDSQELARPPFEVDTAIKVCRQAGYADHALFLAKRYQKSDEYLQIQIEDRDDWHDSLAFIRSLGRDAAEINMLDYGKILLSHAPEDTTTLLIDLCCGTLDRPDDASSANTSQPPPSANYLSYLTYGGKNTTDDASSMNSGTTRRPKGQTPAPESAAADLDRLTNIESPTTAFPEPTVLPNPRQFFAFFIDQPKSFIRFLETVAERRWQQEINPKPRLSSKPRRQRSTYSAVSEDDNSFSASHNDVLKTDPESEAPIQQAIWNTLIELYLFISSRDSSTTTTSDKQAMEAKAIKVLQNPTKYPYDPSQALLVCTMFSFHAGTLLLYENLSLYSEILQFYITRSQNDSSASSKVIEVLQQHGSDEPSLYPTVLRFLTSNSEILSKHQADLKNILNTIQEDNLMPSIEVVQILSRNKTVNVGLVKDWLSTVVSSDRDQITSDRALVDSYRQETAKKRAELAELTDPKNPRIFQVTRCSACGGQLDLPSLHFMCRHSYHQRCLGENESECPTCARQHGVIKELQRENEKVAGHHDLFLQEMSESEDPFNTLAQAFSRGFTTRTAT